MTMAGGAAAIEAEAFTNSGRWRGEISSARGWGPLGLAFLARMARNPVSALPAECYERHDVARRVAHRLVFFPTAPETVRDLFRQDGNALAIADMQVRRFQPAIGEGMIAATGDVWQRQRDVGQQVLSEASRRMVPGEFALDLAAQLAPPGADLLTTLKQACLARFIDLLFPRENPADADLPIGELSRAVDAFALSRQRIALADIVPLPARGAAVTHAFDALIEAEANRSGLQCRLAAARVPMRDFIASMLIGFYPTAIALAWLAVAASRDRRLAHALYDEARSVAADDISPRTMPLAMAALQEALRLYPPFPFATREAVQDCSIGRHHVRRGTLVLASPLLVHRHARLWRAPDRFDPARFAGSRPPRESYFPFGAGERLCIGAGLSMRVLLEGAHALFAGAPGRVANALSVRERGMFLLLPDRPLEWNGR